MVGRTQELEEVGQSKRIPLPTQELDFGRNRHYHRVKLPEEVTEELAENVGLHISDGSMSRRGKAVVYSGHAIDDFPYYTFRFVPLLKRLWGTSRIYYKGVEGEQTLAIRIRSKQFVIFKRKVLGFPLERKRQ